MDAFNIQLRNDTAVNWAFYNPILLAGEPGCETDTNKIKVGDGQTPWLSLNYWVQPATLQVQSDWNETNSSAADFIRNKPVISPTSGAPYVRSGTYFSPSAGIVTLNGAVAIGSNNMYAYPFYCGTTFSITQISQHVGGNANCAVKLACYADNGTFYPGNKLFTAGIVSSAVNALQSINYSYTFTAGNIYWLVSIGGSGIYTWGFVLSPVNNTAYNPILNMYALQGGSTNLTALLYLNVNAPGSFATPPTTFPSGGIWGNAINMPMNPILTIA